VARRRGRRRARCRGRSRPADWRGWLATPPLPAEQEHRGPRRQGLGRRARGAGVCRRPAGADREQAGATGGQYPASHGGSAAGRDLAAQDHDRRSGPPEVGRGNDRADGPRASSGRNKPGIELALFPTPRAVASASRHGRDRLATCRCSRTKQPCDSASCSSDRALRAAGASGRDTPVPAAFECVPAAGAARLQRAADLPQLEPAIELLTEARIADPVYALAFAASRTPYRRRPNWVGIASGLSARSRPPARGSGRSRLLPRPRSALAVPAKPFASTVRRSRLRRRSPRTVSGRELLAAGSCTEQLEGAEKAGRTMFQKAIYLRLRLLACYNALASFIPTGQGATRRRSPSSAGGRSHAENRAVQYLWATLHVPGPLAEAPQVFERTSRSGLARELLQTSARSTSRLGGFSDAARCTRRRWNRTRTTTSVGNLGNAYRHGGQTAQGGVR